MSIAKNATPVKVALRVIGSVVPFLLLGWYGLVAAIMAIVIKSTIPERMNQGSRELATVLWCGLTAFVLSAGAWCPFLVSWPVVCVCMLMLAWPSAKVTEIDQVDMNRGMSRPVIIADQMDMHIRVDELTVISEADVIDV